MFHGQGGYDYATVYNMPIWLRKFTFNKLKEWYEKQNNKGKKEDGDSWLKGEARNEASQNKTVSPMAHMSRPRFKK